MQCLLVEMPKNENIIQTKGRFQKIFANENFPFYSIGRDLALGKEGEYSLSRDYIDQNEWVAS